MGSIIDFDDLSSEGIEASDYDIDRVNELITMAEQAVENYTGRLFRLVEDFTMKVDGNDLTELPLRHPPLVIDSVSVDDEELDATAYELQDDMLPESKLLNPVMIRLDGYTWPQGTRNIKIVGDFGHLLSDGQDPPTYSVPPIVKRAVKTLVIKALPLLKEKLGSTNEGRIKRQRKGNYEEEYFENLQQGRFDDDEVEGFLKDYKRFGIGKV